MQVSHQRIVQDVALVRSLETVKLEERNVVVYAAAMVSSDTKTGDSTIRKTCPISKQVILKYCTEIRSKCSTVKFQMQRKMTTDHFILGRSQSREDSYTPSRGCVAMRNGFTIRLNMVKKIESN